MKKEISNIEELKLFAKEFVSSLQKKDTATIIGLHGNLGAGKTTFVQSVANIFGITENITSPTFVLLKNYEIPAFAGKECGVARKERGVAGKEGVVCNDDNVLKNETLKSCSTESSSVSEVQNDKVSGSVVQDDKLFKNLVHIDAYRLDDAKELQKLNWDFYKNNSDNLIFIEWAEKVADILPEDTINIYFDIRQGDKREVEVK